MFLSEIFTNKTRMVSPERALKGRAEAMPVPETHFVNGNPLVAPFPAHTQTAYFAMGCFWGVERLFWKIDGVYTTAAGYQGGFTPNPTYQETCTGLTGHTEVVMVVFDPAIVSYMDLLKVFFEEHDPTQGMRQGNDIGTVYRSAIYADNSAQLAAALEMKNAYQQALVARGVSSKITTEIADAGPFYYAEQYHQQYLAKNPGGYCGLAGTGVSCPVPSGLALNDPAES